MDALKGYGSDVVVIGGWAPYFLLKSFSHATEEHVGSLDADLALNFRGIPEEAYETLLELIIVCSLVEDSASSVIAW